MKQFAVIGHPIAHSLSPLLHNAAFDHLGLDCRYEAFDIAPEALPKALSEFREKGFEGLNVTLPHKEPVAGLVNTITGEARAVGAVNTISFRGGRITGDNTDIYGFTASVENVRATIERHAVLLLGAGGTARAVIYALLSHFKPAEIIVANRNEQRSRDLVEHFAPYAGTSELKADSDDPKKLRAHIERADLIVNCTSLGLSPAVEGCPVSDDTVFRTSQVVVDLIYTPLQTKLLGLAARSGARTISGLEMFLHQGARSFEIWLGQPMPIDTLRPIIVHELERQRKEPLPRQ
jgi:shikimate dehydrogenase